METDWQFLNQHHGARLQNWKIRYKTANYAPQIEYQIWTEIHGNITSHWTGIRNLQLAMCSMSSSLLVLKSWAKIIKSFWASILLFLHYLPFSFCLYTNIICRLAYKLIKINPCSTQIHLCITICVTFQLVSEESLQNKSYLFDFHIKLQASLKRKSFTILSSFLRVTLINLFPNWTTTHIVTNQLV